MDFDDDWITSDAEEPPPGVVTADGQVPDNAILVKDPAFGTAEAYVVNGYGDEVPLDSIQEDPAFGDDLMVTVRCCPAIQWPCTLQ